MMLAQVIRTYDNWISIVVQWLQLKKPNSLEKLEEQDVLSYV